MWFSVRDFLSFAISSSVIEAASVATLIEASKTASAGIAGGLGLAAGVPAMTAYVCGLLLFENVCWATTMSIRGLVPSAVVTNRLITSVLVSSILTPSRVISMFLLSVPFVILIVSAALIVPVSMTTS